MANRIRLMVLFGGVSSEHEISRTSAASILENINEEKYEIIKVGITRDGKWLETTASPGEIESGAWQMHSSNREVYLMPGTGFAGLDVDVVFPVLHGKNGEDGSMQGFLTIAGVPYVGSDTTSSAAAMDKAIAKAMVDQAEICRQATCCIAHRGCDIHEAIGVIDIFFEGAYPLFVKPANSGSSVGISKVKAKADLAEALRIAFAEDDKVLVEEAILGREIEVAVLGNTRTEVDSDRPLASCIGEIFAANEFYDYRAKYDDIGSRTGVVTDLPAGLEQEIRDTAVGIYEIMGCDGLARVDFFLEPGESGGYEDGQLVFNELNTIPGFTKISMYPQLWQESGMTYSELIDRLVELALKK
ncbi:MAG: D-alanine--D-alanine ligase [Eubacteriales bacterium]|nr:D-alanine--D-alanine ligase [Eubacteriales bacterium]